ncbi:MAG: MFS transporter [Methanomassiliicoccaceae archaeon]|jgi:sugar phosphate permease|nr:MFS transporter [Methanomassiliicoccaceae archaeon]
MRKIIMSLVPRDASEKGSRTLRYRWLIFAVLLAAYFLVYFHRVAPAVVAEDIVDAVGGSMALVASVYFYAYLLMQLPSGALVDRLGPHKITFTFLALAAVGTFIVSFADTFAMVLLGKVMIACGMAFVYIPLTKILAVWFRRKDFATLNGSVIAVGNVAAIAAGAPFAFLISSFGWREVFLVLGIITLILAFLCLLIVRNRPSDIGSEDILTLYPEDRQASETSEKVPFFDGLRAVIASGRAFWMPGLSYFFVYGSIMVFQGLWAAKYFDNVYDFIYAGAWMVTMIGAGKVISAAMAGTIAKKVGSKRIVMLMGNIGYLAIWAIIWSFAGGIDSFWFWMSVNFLFGLFSGFMVLSFAQAKEWFPTSISGTVIAMVNIMIFSGAAVWQTVSGFVIYDSKNATLGQFSTVWLIMMVLVIAACICSYLSIDNNTGDVKKVIRAQPDKDMSQEHPGR